MTAQRMHPGLRAHPRLRAGALIAAIMLMAPGLAHSEVRITETSADTLAIEARDATLREVLEALATSHRLQFSSKDDLSKNVTGRYSGTLQRVLFRLLDGYNVVLRISPAGVRLTVVGLASAMPMPAPVVAYARPVHPGVSRNVDLDEEKAVEQSGGSPVPPRAATAVTTPASQAVPFHASVSSNVDQDEERSVRGHDR